jgi:hypothetical protein
MVLAYLGRMFSEPNRFELLWDRVDCVFCSVCCIGRHDHERDNIRTEL